MHRFTVSPSAWVLGLLAAVSCGGGVVVEDASGAGIGAGNTTSTSATAGGTSTGNGAGVGGGSTTGTASGAGGMSSTNGSTSTDASTSTDGPTTTGSSVSVSSSTGVGGGPPPLDPCGGGPGTVGWIDDMDDGSGKIDPTDGRKGSWYTFNDGTAKGTQTPAAKTAFTMTLIPANAPTPLPGHSMAANTLGGGFNVWGAAMAFDLNNDGITYASYDASKFKGVCFWARVGPKADTGGHTIRLRLLDATTTPEGGVCDPNASSGPTQCYDGFGANLDLTPTWQVFELPWSSLAQQGWGQSAPAITANKLYSMDFDSGASDAFDTWVFGIEFF